MDIKLSFLSQSQNVLAHAVAWGCNKTLLIKSTHRYLALWWIETEAD